MKPQNSSLEEIHSTLIKLRQDHATRKNFPKELWVSIIRLAETYSIKEICQRLEIHPAYLKSKISSAKKTAVIDFQEISIQNIHTDHVVIELYSNFGLSAKIQGSLSCLSCLQQLFRG